VRSSHRQKIIQNATEGQEEISFAAVKINFARGRKKLSRKKRVETSCEMLICQLRTTLTASDMTSLQTAFLPCHTCSKVNQLKQQKYLATYTV
jgi:hypothetical protein